MKNQLKTKRGITLIALVVTIVVLLILAGVSITMLTGEKGLLTQAEKSKIETRAASVQEVRDIWKAEIEIDEATQINETRSLDEVLTELESTGLITEEERDIIEETGSVTIGSRKIEFVETEPLLAKLGWDYSEKRMIVRVNFRQNDYDAYARDTLEGKLPEEIEQIFLEGEYHWFKRWDENAIKFTTMQEYIDYINTEIGKSYTTIDEICDGEGYANLKEMAIARRDVKYEEFLNLNITGNVTLPDGTTVRVEKNQDATMYINEDGTYEFTGMTEDGKLGKDKVITEYAGKYSIFGNGYSLDECSGSVFLAYGYDRECKITTDNLPVLRIENSDEEVDLSEYINYEEYYDQYFVRVYDANSYEDGYVAKIGEIGTITFIVDGQEITWTGKFIHEIF